jgi:hypothetical protein
MGNNVMRCVLLAISITLAGCGVPSDRTAAPNMAQSSRSRAQTLLFSLLHRMNGVAIRRDRRASWMAPEAKAQNLVYLSAGGADEVVVYSYPAGKKSGTLTGLHDPAGTCSDAAGDVWIVNSAEFEVVEYAHAGKKAKATLSDSGAANPLACSVDPTTGNLAVTNLGAASGGGNLSIYTGAKGSPTKYTDPDLMFVYFCGYDDQGNLFVDGLDSAFAFVLAELPSGSETLQTISLSNAVGFPGGVAWDGAYVAIGDQLYKGEHKSAIYQFSVTGSTGTLEGTTALAGSCDVLQFAIPSGGSPRKAKQGNTAVAPDDCLSNAAFYHYPAGGSPTKALSGLQYPVAAAVSLAR